MCTCSPGLPLSPTAPWGPGSPWNPGDPEGPASPLSPAGPWGCREIHCCNFLLFFYSWRIGCWCKRRCRSALLTEGPGGPWGPTSPSFPEAPWRQRWQVFKQTDTASLTGQEVLLKIKKEQNIGLLQQRQWVPWLLSHQAFQPHPSHKKIKEATQRTY